MTHLLRTSPLGRTTSEPFDVTQNEALHYHNPFLQRIATAAALAPSEVWRKLTSGEPVRTRYGYEYKLKRGAA